MYISRTKQVRHEISEKEFYFFRVLSNEKKLNFHCCTFKFTTDSIESRLQGKCYQNILCMASWQGGKEGAKGPIFPGSLNKDKVKYA
jgi:hypothetical protein